MRLLPVDTEARLAPALTTRTDDPSFMGANFVARELRYRMVGGWSEGDAAAQEYFRSETTFAERFDALLSEISGAGFRAIDLWAAHLHPSWATENQVREALRLLDAHGLRLASLAAWLPADAREIENACRLARALDCRLIGGGCDAGVLTEGRDSLVEALEQNEVVFGYENHPETSLREILEKIGPRHDRIGITLDTGWLGTQGVDAVAAARELAPRIVHVHLKDIREPRKSPGPTLRDMGHETCVLGDGIVPVERCVDALKIAGYRGGISIEHEPEDRDPMPEVSISLHRVRKWLKIH